MNLPISFVFILVLCNFQETQAVRFKKCSESKPDVMFLDRTDVSTYLELFKKIHITKYFAYRSNISGP